MAGPNSRPHSRPSLPSSSGEPSLRRLGVGSSTSERPVRAQLVVAVVAALTLIAVPLYLMRRPEQRAQVTLDAGVPDAGKPAAPAAEPVVVADAGKPVERLRVGAPQRVRCGATPKGGQEGNLCDQLAPLEEALVKTIKDNESCVPRVKETASINYVLTVDFTKKKLHLFPGASGDLRGARARRSTTCVLRALPKPDWDALRHQYRHYAIAVLATYAPESVPISAPAPAATPASPGVPGSPRFD